jgi:hypothetical protein
MMELGSATTGTSFMSMYQNIMAGQMFQRSILAWDQLGLVDQAATHVQAAAQYDGVMSYVPVDIAMS